MSANYRKFSFTIPVGGFQQIERLGDFFYVISADQPFSVSWDDGGVTPFDAGLKYSLRDGETFQRSRLVNNGAAPLNITVGIGIGGISDARLTVSGAIDARDNGGQSFGDVVSATQAVGDEVVAESALTRSAIDAAMWNDLTGFTFETTTISQTIVSEAENINGVEVALACCASGASQIVQFQIGGVDVLTSRGQGAAVTVERLLVPPAQSLGVLSTAGGHFNIIYKVL